MHLPSWNVKGPIIGNSTKWAECPQDDEVAEDPTGPADDYIFKEGTTLKKIRRGDEQGMCSPEGDHMNHTCVEMASGQSNADAEGTNPAEKMGTQIRVKGNVRLTDLGRIRRRGDGEDKHTEEEHER
jgi:hypothetical protein